jgi:hypothetical protein
VQPSLLFAVAYQIGGGTLNLPDANGLELPPTPVTNIVVTRDEQSLKPMRIYSDFFKEHPERPQARSHHKGAVSLGNLRLLSPRPNLTSAHVNGRRLNPMVNQRSANAASTAIKAMPTVTETAAADG